MRTFITLTTLFLFFPLLCAEDTKKLSADKERIIKTVRFLSEENFPCSADPVNKEKTIDYIAKSLTTAGLKATRDEFNVVFQEGTFTNVHAMKKGKTNKRIIVGAHYDAVAESPGADDNASAVAALIELAFLLKEAPPLNCDVEFAAYDIEEWGLWGSQHHAKKLKSEKVEVVCMLCLDMVGYFSEAEGSQTYPIANMKTTYGTKGDFLAMIGQTKDAKLVADAKKAFQESVSLRIESFLSPPVMETLFTVSDHAPFWQQKYPALFFTDTAYYRTAHYHRKSDTWDTLDYNRLAQVPVGLYHIILTLDAEK